MIPDLTSSSGVNASTKAKVSADLTEGGHSKQEETYRLGVPVVEVTKGEGDLVDNRLLDALHQGEEQDDEVGGEVLLNDAGGLVDLQSFLHFISKLGLRGLELEDVHCRQLKLGDLLYGLDVVGPLHGLDFVLVEHVLVRR